MEVWIKAGEFLLAISILVIVHEFGHLLGMIHEHSRADVPFNWNKNAVYAALGQPPNSWSHSMVDDQVFTPIQTDAFNGSAYDKNSIMHYYFQPDFFSPPFDVPHTYKLSDLDTVWINHKYPGKALPKGINPDLNPSSTSKNWFQTYWYVILIIVLVLVIILYIILRRK